MVRSVRYFLVAVAVAATTGLTIGTASADEPVPTPPASQAVRDALDAIAAYVADTEPWTVQDVTARYEDEPGWDCRTSGNRVCGPGTATPGYYGPGEVPPVTPGLSGAWLQYPDGGWQFYGDTDPLSAERATAARLITERRVAGLPVADDLTWAGAPDVVAEHNDYLIGE